MRNLEKLSPAAKWHFFHKDFWSLLIGSTVKILPKKNCHSVSPCYDFIKLFEGLDIEWSLNDRHCENCHFCDSVSRSSLCEAVDYTDSLLEVPDVVSLKTWRIMHFNSSNAQHAYDHA